MSPTVRPPRPADSADKGQRGPGSSPGPGGAGPRPAHGPRSGGQGQGGHGAPGGHGAHGAGQDGAAPAEGEEAEAPAGEVQVNEDGSITVAESGVAKVTVAQRWTGIGVKPDARYGSILVSKFINCLMYDGKKSLAEGVFYDAMAQIADKIKADPLPVFEQGIENAKPVVEVRSKRIGGANYQVPVEVNRKRQQTLAIRWILEAVRSRKGRPVSEKLAQELIDCYNKTGTTIQKRENTHRMAEANKAFSHFA